MRQAFHKGIGKAVCRFFCTFFPVTNPKGMQSIRGVTSTWERTGLSFESYC